MRNRTVLAVAMMAFLLGKAPFVNAATVTDPNDPRTWQGASVGTFALLYYGADNPANRQKVVDNKLLDDGIFSSAGYVAASLVVNAWASAVPGGAESTGQSTGSGVGDYSYVITNESRSSVGNAIDRKWFQSSGIVGNTVFDLGFQASKAAIFPIIDHGPIPQETIESTVYLSNDKVTWTQAVVQKVWLEGFDPNTSNEWDGFTYAVGTGTADTFRYASLIHGGPGALIDDGDDEINGVMGLRDDFTPDVPEPSSVILFAFGSLGMVGYARKRRQKAKQAA